MQSHRKTFTAIGLSISAYIIIRYISSSYVYTLVRVLFPSLSTLWARHVATDVFSALIITPLILMVLRLNTFSIVPRQKMDPKTALCLIPVSMGLVYVGNIAALIVNGILTALSGDVPQNQLENFVSQSSPVSLMVFAVILAPITEELLFRKFLIDPLYPYGEKVCMIVSGLMFAAVHGNFYQFFYAFLLGSLFAWVYCRTGNILYTIGLHMFVNFTGSFVPMILRSIHPYFAYVFALQMAALGILGLLLLFKHGKRALPLRAPSTPLRFAPLVIVGNIGMVVFIITAGTLFIINM